MLQINVDGSMKENPNRGGWGFIIRNQEGHPVGAGAGPVEHILDRSVNNF